MSSFPRIQHLGRPDTSRNDDTTEGGETEEEEQGGVGGEVEDAGGSSDGSGYESDVSYNKVGDRAGLRAAAALGTMRAAAAAAKISTAEHGGDDSDGSYGAGEVDHRANLPAAADEVGHRAGVRAAAAAAATISTAEHWVQCDSCNKWRRVARAVDPGRNWVCRYDLMNTVTDTDLHNSSNTSSAMNTWD